MAFCDFEGHFLPLFGKSEMEWPNGIRIVLYCLGLSWCFLGIALISDIFMAAIEKITSRKKRVMDTKTGHMCTVYAWNPTVANLTLMALGSSAPEILLSVIEILGNSMFIGELGAGTIVGSAAFNLLIISAVCICSIPGQDVRRIKEVPVYVITASTSVFAYIWLMFILMVTSPDVCEIWEGVLTFLFFPLLVLVAFMADKGYFTKDYDSSSSQKHTISENVSKEELAGIVQNIRQLHGASLTDQQVVKFIEQEYTSKPTLASYRRHAMGKKLWGKSVTVESSALVCTPTFTTDEIHADKLHKTVTLGFKTLKIAVLEDCETAKLVVVRGGFRDCGVTVKYATSDGNALAGSDYEKVVPTTLKFKPGETEKEVFVKIQNDAAYEEDEWFFVELSEPTCDGVGCQVQVRDAKAKIAIIDDDLPGQLRFQSETMEVTQEHEDKVVNVIVERFGGASGTIGCSYRTEDDSAVAKFDFEEVSGKLEFGPRVQTVSFPITIKATGRYERQERFRIILEEPSGNTKFDEKTDGGAKSCVLTVEIKASQARRATIDAIAAGINWNKMSVGTTNWKDQFKDAIRLPRSEEGTSVMEVIMHVVSIPWKVMFAFVPPTDYCNGWACFSLSLVFIAGMTALVGDMANLVGCTLGLESEITAITLVALGTSLPDTFASRTAAAIDEHADASIGNITGSNAVNVFLGLGLPWTMAAIYWASAGQTDQWLAKLAPGGLYSEVADSVKGFSGGVFVVPGGTLWFNLMVFSLNAGCALAHLYLRRRKYGGELGGPRKAQYFSAVFLLTQWVIYVGLSSMWVTIQKNK